MQHQQQFMGCSNEILAFSDIYMQMDMGQLFTEYSAHQSDFEEFFTSEQWQPSSSSSSWFSFSTGSPEFSSLIKSGSSSSIPEKCHEIKFPTFTSNDIVIAEAMSSIFSDTSSIPTSSMSHKSLGEGQPNQNLVSMVRSHSGFKPYTSAVLPDSVLNKKYCGQKMIKGSIAILRKINMMKDEASNQESSSSGTQLHHVISERKRREKLNESFYGLRQLLPPCSKKDKASVLCRTKDYLKTLEAQIFNLEKSNQMLEMRPDEAKEVVGGTISSIDLQIVEAFEPAIGIKRINFKITVRIECDLLELVLHALEYLKEIRAISLVSIDANTYLQKMIILTWVKLLFDIKATDWDEVSFKAGIIRAVDSATMSLSSS